jgi:hypothetical protein
MHCISVSCFGLIARIVYFQTREVRPTVIECLLPDWKRQRLISMQQCRVFLQDGDRRGHSLCRTTNERQVSCGWRQQHAGDDANDASQSPKWRGFGHCQGRHARRSCIETLACDPADTVTLSSRSLDIAAVRNPRVIETHLLPAHPCEENQPRVVRARATPS